MVFEGYPDKKKWWFSTVNLDAIHGQEWSAMDNHGYPLLTTDNRGWRTMVKIENNGYPLLTADNRGGRTMVKIENNGYPL